MILRLPSDAIPLFAVNTFVPFNSISKSSSDLKAIAVNPGQLISALSNTSFAFVPFSPSVAGGIAGIKVTVLPPAAYVVSSVGNGLSVLPKVSPVFVIFFVSPSFACTATALLLCSIVFSCGAVCSSSCGSSFPSSFISSFSSFTSSLGASCGSIFPSSLPSAAPSFTSAAAFVSSASADTGVRESAIVTHTN